MDQLVHAAVVAHIDNDPALAQQLAALPPQAVGQVRQQLQAAAPTGPADADKIAERSAWLAGQLGTDELTTIQRDRVAEVVERRVGFSVNRLKSIMQWDVDSWLRLPRLQADRGATLAGEFNTTTLAIRTTDATIFTDFKPPSGFGVD